MEFEIEIGIIIFNRINRGIIVFVYGVEFLGYVK